MQTALLRGSILLFSAIFCLDASTAKPVSKSLFPKQQLTPHKVPIAFEPNQGQSEPDVRFLARTGGQTILLRDRDLTIATASGSLRMQLVGAGATARAEGTDLLPGVSNYFIGKDPARWRTNIPHYARLRYRDVYPGIDMVFYTNERELEFDFVVAPGADPAKIKLAYDGMERMRKDSSGDLLFQMADSQIRLRRPKVYQQEGGIRTEVAASYRMERGAVGIALAGFDRKRPVIIDPAVEYTTYLGGEGYDFAAAVVVDATGNAYLTGGTNSPLLPVTQQSAQNKPGGATDSFVAKFSQFGELAFVTYLGGTGTDTGNGIALDSSGNIFVSGFTTSADFPVRNAFQTAYAGALDAFVTKLASTGGSLIYSTYLGGTGDDFGNALAVDSAGSAYITGWTSSADFPVRNAFQSGPAGGGSDTFVTKLSPSGSALVYSTFVGGNGEDLGSGIAIDSTGAAYVTGGTKSTLFPLVSAVQGRNGGGYDAFVFKLAPAGNALVYATFLGGDKDDFGYRIALDSANNAYLTGYTQSVNFPVRNAFQSTLGGGTDVFVSKLSAAGDTLAYSTYLGGSADDWGFGNIVVDAAGSAYVTGWTASTNFPLRNAAQAGYGGGKYDAFITRLAPGGNTLLYSTSWAAGVRRKAMAWRSTVGRRVPGGPHQLPQSARGDEFPAGG
jgi:Beta-propeller repeat.